MLPRRRHTIPLILLLASIPLVVLADTTVDYLAAKSSGDKVTVEWKTGVETDVAKFDVERATYGTQQFDLIGSVKSKGSYTYYSFVDETGFQKPAGPTTLYQYRLRIWNVDGTSATTKPTLVEHAVSSVRRTWGQIKEMFR